MSLQDGKKTLQTNNSWLLVLHVRHEQSLQTNILVLHVRHEQSLQTNSATD